MNIFTYTPMKNPVAEKERWVALDILRGAAVLGILLMNIREFSLPANFSEAWRGDPDNANFWIYNLIHVLFEGKMRAMFSLLFGAGILLFSFQKEDPTPLFYKRMLVLLIFGLMDTYLFLWIGDILFYYSICGMIVYLFRKMKPIYLSLAVPIVAILGFIGNSIFLLNAKQTRLLFNEAMAVQAEGKALRKDQVKSIEEWRNLEKTLLQNNEEIKKITAHYKGTYRETANYVWPQSFLYQTTYLPMSIADPIALMLLGMALLKWGYLTTMSSKKHKRILKFALIIGLPLAIWNTWYQYKNFPNYDSIILYIETKGINWMILVYEIQRIALVLAIISAIIIIYRAGILQLTFRMLSNVGRLALTNYLGQSIICGFVFYGCGLNFYAEWDYKEIILFVPLVWLFQIIFSHYWLKHYTMGPLEWVWRSLIYGKMETIKRKDR